MRQTRHNRAFLSESGASRSAASDALRRSLMRDASRAENVRGIEVPDVTLFRSVPEASAVDGLNSVRAISGFSQSQDLSFTVDGFDTLTTRPVPYRESRSERHSRHPQCPEPARPILERRAAPQAFACRFVRHAGALRRARARRHRRAEHARREPDEVAPRPHDLVLRALPARAAAAGLSRRFTRSSATCSTPTTTPSAPCSAARSAGCCRARRSPRCAPIASTSTISCSSSSNARPADAEHRVPRHARSESRASSTRS